MLTTLIFKTQNAEQKNFKILLTFSCFCDMIKEEFFVSLFGFACFVVKRRLGSGL